MLIECGPTGALIRFARFPRLLVFLPRPVSITASLYCEFLPENRAYARKGFPVFRAALVQPGDSPPPDGRPGLSGLTEITRLAMMPASQKRKTKMTNTKNETAETKKSAPIAKVRVDLINASIWKNTTDKGTFYNVTFENRYRDGEGNWKSGHSYAAGDLLALAKAADLAHSKIIELREGEE
jgi:hypothetical protein